MGPNVPHFEFIYHVGIIYKGWVDSKFTLMYKNVLVIM